MEGAFAPALAAAAAPSANVSAVPDGLAASDAPPPAAALAAASSSAFTGSAGAAAASGASGSADRAKAAEALVKRLEGWRTGALPGPLGSRRLLLRRSKATVFLCGGACLPRPRPRPRPLG